MLPMLAGLGWAEHAGGWAAHACTLACLQMPGCHWLMSAIDGYHDTATDLPDLQSVTLEPGGQFELSGATLDTLHKTCAEVNSHLYQARPGSDGLRLLLTAGVVSRTRCAWR